MNVPRSLLTSLAALAALPLLLLACSGSSSGGSTSIDGGVDASSDGSAESGSCRDGVDHRATAAACTSNADAGLVESGCGSPITPRDGCLKDDDCAGAHGATGVCVCQAPHGNGCGTPFISGNACVPSNCRLDSDCSPCSKCRLEQSCGQVTGFYCETKLDTCSTNADCGTGFCSFRGDRWACVNDVACAG